MPVSRYTFDPEALKSFLRDLFDYDPKDTIFIEIRYIGEKVYSKYLRYEEIERFAERLKNTNYLSMLEKYNVYFGVLPRENFHPTEFNEDGKPKVAGKKQHVIRGRWLWADYDCKREIQSPPEMCVKDLEEKGYCVLEDDPVNGRLHVIFRINNRYYEIDKPSYDEILDLISKAEKEFGLKTTYVIDSGYGYHFYLKLSKELSAKELEPLEKLYAKLMGNDPKVGELARIMRLPYTLNTKYKELGWLRPVKIVHHNDVEQNPEEIKKLLDKAKEKIEQANKEIQPKIPSRRRELNDRQIRQIVELLKPYWVYGHRQNIEVFLSGFLWWNGVGRETFRKIIDIITAETGDEQRDKRLGDVDYLWDRAEERFGNKIAGRNYLIEELEEAIKKVKPHIENDDARDEAIKIVEKIEEIIKTVSRSVLMRVPYETGTWFVNDPKRGIILLKETTNRDGEIVRTRKYIMQWYMDKVLVVKTKNSYYYKIRFRNARTKEKIVLGGSLDEIVKQLRVHGVQRKTMLYDAVSSIISEFIRRKIAKIKHTSEASGIYLKKDKLIVVKNGVISSIMIPHENDNEKVKQAVEYLKQLREHYDKYKFDIAMQWTAYSIISYVLKKNYNVKQYYLFLHGERQTGKSTLAKIITTMFPVKLAKLEEVPVEGGSEYRLAFKLNSTTFPILEDEIENIQNRQGLISLIKRASTGIAVRWRGDTGTIYRARAPLIFTSNRREVFSDSALVERLLLLEFDHNDYVYTKPKEKLDKFKDILNKYLAIAPYLGKALIDLVQEIWEEIKTNYVHRLHDKEDILELGRFIWSKFAEKYGVEIPWVVRYDFVEEKVEDREREMLFEIIEDAVREAIMRGKIDPSVYRDRYFSDIIVELYEKYLLPPWLHVIKREGILCISKTVLEIFRKKYGYMPIGGLKQLAQRLGYTYGVKRPRGKSTKCMIIPLTEFLYSFSSEEEEEPIEEGNMPEDNTGITIEPAYLESLAHDVDNILFDRNMEINKENIYNILLELGLPPGEDTEKIAEKVYEKLKEKA